MIPLQLISTTDKIASNRLKTNISVFDRLCNCLTERYMPPFALDSHIAEVPGSSPGVPTP